MRLEAKKRVRWARYLAAVATGGVVLVGTVRGPALSPDRASWELTPGVLNPEVTQDSISETVCREGWTDTIRRRSTTRMS